MNRTWLRKLGRGLLSAVVAAVLAYLTSVATGLVKASGSSAASIALGTLMLHLLGQIANAWKHWGEPAHEA